MKKLPMALCASCLAGALLGAAQVNCTRFWPLNGTLEERNGFCPFSGEREIFTTNDDPLYDLAPGMSFSCRVKLDQVQQTQGWTTILQKGLVNRPGSFWLRVDRPDEHVKFSFFINTDGRPEPRVSVPVVVTTNRWYDIAAGWDGTNVWMTVNGETRRTPRRGARVGCAGPLTAGPIHGTVADLSFTGVPAPDDGDMSIAPGLLVACDVTFDELPKGETYLLRKPLEYMIRYDRSKKDGKGAFNFFVYLNGGWEPRVGVPMEVEVGRRYNVVAGWDGLRSTLQVEGASADVKRSGRAAPTPAKLGPCSFKGCVGNVRVRSQKTPLPVLRELRTRELLPRTGERVTLLGELANLGSPVSNCVLDVSAQAGATVSPTRIPVGVLDQDTVVPVELTIDPGTNGAVQTSFTLLSGKKKIATFGKRTAIMPRQDPDFSARAWNPPVKPTRTYHVDGDAGDDAKDGLTPATAWRSFARVKDLTLGPGERLLLKRGCSFNEELVVTATGAADNWAEIGAYGDGPRPAIRRNRHIDDRCAHIVSPQYLIVHDLIFCNAGKGLDIACVGRASGGILVERCLAHHIEGHYRFNAHGIPEWRDCRGAPGPGAAAGLSIVGPLARNIVFRDCEAYQCSSGFKTSGHDVWQSRIFCHDNISHNTSPHPFCTGTLRAWIVDSIFDASGWNASAGTMGIMLGFNDGLVIRNSHFLNQPDSGSHDEGGIDFEAGGENCLIDRCTFRNNAGAAIEVLGLRSPQVKCTHIRNCRFDRNNVATKLGPSEIFVWGGTTDRGVVCSSGRIEGNGYVLNPGICFYTNRAESTRKDWTLVGNTQYATPAELDRALPYNNPPMVDAGVEIWTDKPDVQLAGVASDDGRTPFALTTAWDQIEGPGTVRVAAPEKASTTAVFPKVGDYRLLLRADDGELWRTARTAVHVLPRGAKVAKAWTFAKNLDDEGWKPVALGTVKEIFKGAKPIWDTFANPVQLVCGDYYILAIKEATEPHLLSADHLGVQLAEGTCDVAVLRLQNHTNAKRMRLSFMTEADAAWQTRDFDVVPDDLEDRVYVVPLAATGILRQMRLDFTVDGMPVMGTCRLDYIWLGTLPR